MTLKKTIFLIIFISSAGLGYAQAKKSAAKPKAPVPLKPGNVVQPANSLLWEITGRGLTQPSYLYGTMHILCAEDAKLSEGLKKAIKDSKQIYFEVDMDNMQEMMGALQFIRMNDGVKLSDLLTPLEYGRIKDYFDKNKSMLPFAMMNRFKPYFITAMLSSEIMGCDEKSGSEQLIMTESKKYDKNISGLESIEFQASIFDSIPYQKQAKDLLMYVDSIDHYKKVSAQMVDLYRKQDINNIDTLLQQSDPGMTDYMDILLFGRNKRWAMQMPEQMFQMSTLFAVGAGHLGGENGVINLLRKDGFTVKPLKN
jgi:uncharacterized protein YbaP (TraB family)